MNKTNKKYVLIRNSSDNRQVTGTFLVTLSGKFLPLQIIYQDKMSRGHAKCHFLSEFNVTHTENHSSNEGKAMELVKHILISYVRKFESN